MKGVFFVALCSISVLLTACDSVEEEGIEVVLCTQEIVKDGNSLGWLANVDENGVVVLEDDTTGIGLAGGIWRILFLDVGEPLPELISVTLDISPSQALFNHSTLVSGTVCLQDWDLQGIISGEVKGEMRPGWPSRQPESLTKFWVDFGEQP